MRLCGLVLENYRIFYGKNKLSFDEGDLHVVVGKNGFGKSTIIDGIFFALYGKERLDGVLVTPIAQELINSYAYQKAERYCRASLEFQQGAVRYQAMHEVVDGTFRHSLKINGERSEVPIEDILPQDAAELYFFDGARISHTLDAIEPSAIERILGISELRRARGDVMNVREQLERSLSTMGKLRALLWHGKHASRVRALRAKRQKLHSQLSRESARADELEREIKAAEQEMTRVLTQKQAQVERERLTDRHLGLSAEFERFKEELPYLILKAKLEWGVRTLSRRKDMALKAQVQQGRLLAQEELLESIVAGKRCICGTPLSTSNFGQIEIENLLKELKTKSAGLKTIPLDAYAQSSEELSRALHKVRSLDRDPLALRDELARVERELKRRRRTMAAGIEEVVAEQLETLRVERKARELRLEDIRTELADTENELESRHAQLRRAAHRRKGRLLRQLRNAESMIAALDELIENTIWARRRQTEQYATRLFRGITNKPREYKGLELREDYAIGLKGAAVGGAKLSDGERQVIALSFLGGLKEELMVIEAPFTRLDSVHKKRLLDKMPQLADQVILLVVDRDLSSQELNRLTRNVWYLKRNEAKKVSRIYAAEHR